MCCSRVARGGRRTRHAPATGNTRNASGRGGRHASRSNLHVVWATAKGGADWRDETHDAPCHRPSTRSLFSPSYARLPLAAPPLRSWRPEPASHPPWGQSFACWRRMVRSICAHFAARDEWWSARGFSRSASCASANRARRQETGTGRHPGHPAAPQRRGSRRAATLSQCLPSRPLASPLSPLASRPILTASWGSRPRRCCTWGARAPWRPPWRCRPPARPARRTTAARPWSGRA